MSSTAEALSNLVSVLRETRERPKVRLDDKTFELARKDEDRGPGIATIEGIHGASVSWIASQHADKSYFRYGQRIICIKY